MYVRLSVVHRCACVRVIIITYMYMHATLSCRYVILQFNLLHVGVLHVVVHRVCLANWSAGVSLAISLTAVAVTGTVRATCMYPVSKLRIVCISWCSKL